MELRALLFTSDGGSTATLCHVLDELGLQAEICPELLVAVGRLSTERYDAIIVDWSQETEAAILLKTAREKKALALNVALVADEVRSVALCNRARIPSLKSRWTRQRRATLFRPHAI